VPEEQVSALQKTVRNVMETTVQLSVPLVVDVGSGTHWGQAH